MVEVKLHDIGEGMHEAEILSFLVETGEAVKNDAPLVEVQTDKMTAELTAPSAGVVSHIEANVGDVIEVGDTILKIDDSNGVEAQRNEHPQEAQKATLEVLSPPPTRRVLATPYTRKIARDHEIDIEQVKGTGSAGRVTDEDVYAYIEEISVPEETFPETKPSPEQRTAPVQHPGAGLHTQETRSFITAPSAVHSEEVDVTYLLRISEPLNISFNSFFIKGIQVALQDYPSLNARVDESEGKVYLSSECHFEVSHPVYETKVIQNVEQSSIRDIEDGLAKDHLKSGATFTIHHLENANEVVPAAIHGSQAGGAIISPIHEKAMVYNQEITTRSMVNVTLTFDTRAVTGLTALAFSRRVKQLLENPNLMLLELI
ncbi:pyruvate dehydrogenase E2 component (dihydrolipoamide acetyltransferase) [Geomicrobium halophilum]|uniref:Dihydrolipoamide acetyltransferase component of pyruvate dehydrogenase complex n=1 Tax=Geomicrobium halophilum TaxID=549000 RepID=A0A841PR08_9BACL|nr:2-oxo acid dehydrogenase subunit E2 [Geomicrobium halophilum]MBB6451327.1 pyruvate dehydrogenase E2 component (dihydrolipoamide acetyltransferase) [Geomicrobium halophilum]